MHEPQARTIPMVPWQGTGRQNDPVGRVAAVAREATGGAARAIRAYRRSVTCDGTRIATGPAMLVESETVVPYIQARRDALSVFERTYLTSLLERSQDNVAKAAREAGVNRAYLHKLLRRHGLR